MLYDMFIFGSVIALVELLAPIIFDENGVIIFKNCSDNVELQLYQGFYVAHT